MTIKALVFSFALAACGGGAPSSATGPAATTTPAAPAAAGPRLALAPSTITVAFGSKTGTIEIAADGTFVAKTGDREKRGKLTADGELWSDDAVLAKLGDDGSVSVLERHIQKVDGQEVKHDEKWTVVGTLAADGTFTATKDGKTLAFDADGKLGGLPPDISISVSAADPAARRAAMLLVISAFAAGTSVSDTSAATAPATPATAPTPATTP